MSNEQPRLYMKYLTLKLRREVDLDVLLEKLNNIRLQRGNVVFWNTIVEALLEAETGKEKEKLPKAKKNGTFGAV